MKIILTDFNSSIEMQSSLIQTISVYLSISLDAAASLIKSQPQSIYLTTLSVESTLYNAIKLVHETIPSELNLNSELYSPDYVYLFATKDILKLSTNNTAYAYVDYAIFDYHYSRLALHELNEKEKILEGTRMTPKLLLKIQATREKLEKLKSESERILYDEDYFYFSFY